MNAKDQWELKLLESDGSERIRTMSAECTTTAAGSSSEITSFVVEEKKMH